MRASWKCPEGHLPHPAATNPLRIGCPLSLARITESAKEPILKNQFPTSRIMGTSFLLSDGSKLKDLRGNVTHNTLSQHTNTRDGPGCIQK